jgi:hypothetical protein
MTVGELIEKLESVPPETLVLTDGYESGFEDISILEEYVVRDNGGDDENEQVWYYGDYSVFTEKIHTGIEPIPAIILSRF